MSKLVKRLAQEFADKDYAYAYMEAHESNRIAAQIKVLREQRNLTQAQLAELSGMLQERISTVESADYNAWTMKTLRKLARAFDTHLHVSFVPFSEGIKDVDSISRNRLEVKSREDDLKQLSTQYSDNDANGKWESTNSPNMSRVFTSHKDPVEPKAQDQWQSLDIVKTA